MSSGDGTGARLQQFKNKGKDFRGLRRTRAEVSMELRKAKRDARISLTRGNIHSLLDEQEPHLQSFQHWTVEDIVRGVNSQTLDCQLQATHAARRLLCVKMHIPVDAIIAAGLIPKFVCFLALFECPSIQLEAALALTEITAGSSPHTSAVIQEGAIPAFISLAASPHDVLRDQALFALGSIAGSGSTYRDLIIKHGGLHPILALLETPNLSVFSSTYLRIITWTLCNLCRNIDSEPPLALVQHLLPALLRLLYYDDREVLADTCCTFSYLTEGSNKRIEVVLQAGPVPRLVQLLTCGDLTIVSPALQTLGNIVTGTEEQTQSVLNAGFLAVLPGLLQHYMPSIQKDAAWTVSNITAGRDCQIQQVIDAGLVPILVDILQQGNYKTQMEALWAISNYTSSGTMEQVAYLVKCNVLEPLLNMLSAKESHVVVLILVVITNILQMAIQVGESEKLCQMIEEVNGLDKIKALQFHEKQAVSRASFDIVDKFFCGEIDC
ncbi:importin subunit alpha-1-like [Thalassophryne amazonica]|uniref:importin subunit alpha-1-like n=1 Tax=Thalassophryne amazonica TaxID=390379 RepID=UPI001470AA70|nr:importin subunit alpha-1-like [Thalassophryne amazonica]